MNYTKCYPSIIDPIKIGGLYDLLLEHKGAFIDYYYKNVDTKSLSYIYFMFERKEELTFNYNSHMIDHKMFWVYPDSSVQITSKSYLPILKILICFVREYKINSILN